MLLDAFLCTLLEILSFPELKWGTHTVTENLHAIVLNYFVAFGNKSHYLKLKF